MPSLHCSLRVSAAAPAVKTPKVFPARQRSGPAVKTNPQSMALISGERSMSHAQLDARSRRAASALNDLGVNAGDRVGLLMWNDFSYFEATRATAMLGAVNVPLNWHLTRAETAGILEHSGARVVVAHSGLLGERSGQRLRVSEIGVGPHARCDSQGVWPAGVCVSERSSDLGGLD